MVAGGAYTVVYSELWHARKHSKDDEPFHQYQFAGTVIVGTIIGGAFARSGTTVTVETVSTALTANVGVIALTEPLLKIVFEKAGQFPNDAG